jgi:glycosyltransferase involved in cell wall biosynthesis
LACPNSHFLIDRTGTDLRSLPRRTFLPGHIQTLQEGLLLASGMAAFEAYCNRWMRVLKKIDAFLTPSRFLKSKLLENGFHENQVHHLPLFLPKKNFWEGDQDQGYLLFLGRLEAIKGINVLIEAARKANEVPFADCREA